MKLRLRTKIIMICVAIFFLAIGASTTVNGIYFTKEYFQVRKSETFVIAQTLKSQLDRLLKMHIPLEQLEGFEEMCQEIVAKHAFLSYAMVVDPAGKILFHNNPGRHNQRISDAALLNGIKSGRKTAQLFSMNGETFYDFMVPVFGGRDEHIATIRTGFPSYLVSDKTRTLALYSAGITLLAFAVGIFLIVVSLDLWVTRPARRFIRTMLEIRREGTSATQAVEIKYHDEFGELAQAFNEMTEELRETTVSKDFMDNIVENMLNSLIIVDGAYTIRAVNQETLNLLGYTEAELVGASIGKVFAKPCRADASGLEKKPLVEPVRAVETRYLSKSGRSIPVLFSSSIMTSKERKPQGYICVAQDITELKTLRGFLPICAACKKIRDDSGYWNKIENYLEKHSTAQLSHAICPECEQRLYGNQDWYEASAADELPGGDGRSNG